MVKSKQMFCVAKTSKPQYHYDLKKQILFFNCPPNQQFISIYQAALSCVDCGYIAALVRVKSNLSRLLSCVEELRSLPQEGCITQWGALLKQAVLDGLQQFKQHMCHKNQADFNSSYVEVTVVSSQSGHAVLRQLEQDLKNSDLMGLRRLLVVHITSKQNPSDGSLVCSPETSPSSENKDQEEGLMLAAEMDLQTVEATVVAVEGALKMWLHVQAGDREHLHLLLPPSLEAQQPQPTNNKTSSVCLKCDMQERLLSPALIPSAPKLGVKTESVQDFLPSNKSLTNRNSLPPLLRVVKVLHADGVCQSVLYGLPLVIRPTLCWQLDWDEMETNQHMFHGLCHILRVAWQTEMHCISRDWFLLVRSEPESGSNTGTFSYYILQSSSSLSLLLKPVLSRELMLPCALPVPTEDPPLSTLAALESSLEQLEKDFLFNPLCLDSNLYTHLRISSLLTRSSQPFAQGRTQRRGGKRPAEGAVPRQSRQSHSRVKATVAPLPFTPGHKMSRPSLALRCPQPSFQDDLEEEDPLMIQ